MQIRYCGSVKYLRWCRYRGSSSRSHTTLLTVAAAMRDCTLAIRGSWLFDQSQDVTLLRLAELCERIDDYCALRTAFHSHVTELEITASEVTNVLLWRCRVSAVHEKIFVVFMVTAVLYELLTLIVFKWAHPDLLDKPQVGANCCTSAAY